ncbi:hypothetical protein [uncultured Lamprocystis sp.]|uniref:hypothetical protein n=1 Tax=uncultured Lamprocystis sp. TaxID=543132 RepID=UPI0025CF98A6|nr:hypothetical protein [uncultured Lamprocystis sp.]
MKTIGLNMNNARGFAGRLRRRGAGWCRHPGILVAADARPGGSETQEATLTGVLAGPAENPAASAEPAPRGRGLNGGRGAGACRRNGGGLGLGRGAGGGQARRGRI